MKRRHLPSVFLLLLLSLLSLSFRRRLLLPQPPRHPAGDTLLCRLATKDAGSDQVLAEAETLFANASISTFPSLGNHHRHLYLRLPYSPSTRGPPWPRTVSCLRIPAQKLPSDESLLASFCSSLRSFVASRRRPSRNVASVMRDPADGLLGRQFRTCAVLENSGVLLGSDHGAQIDTHDLVIRLNNARVAGFAADVGVKTSLSFVNSNILHTCAARNVVTYADCGCHPYSAAVPMAMYICQPAHLLDDLICNATVTPTHRQVLVAEALYAALLETRPLGKRGPLRAAAAVEGGGESPREKGKMSHM